MTYYLGGRNNWRGDANGQGDPSDGTGNGENGVDGNGGCIAYESGDRGYYGNPKGDGGSYAYIVDPSLVIENYNDLQNSVMFAVLNIRTYRR